MKNTRKTYKLLSALLVLVLSFGIIGCGTGTTNSKAENTGNTENTEKNTGENSKEEKVVKLAVQKSIITPYVAEALGYYEEEFGKDNIKIELVEFTLGPAVVEAFGSKQVDIGFLGDLPAYAGLVNGGEYKIIGKYEESLERSLIVRDDANIKTLADLKGKKVAVPFGSNLQPLVSIYLESVGLSVNDIELINLSLADITTSIGNGDIDAAVTDQPYIAQAIANGGVTRLVTSEGYKDYVSPIIAQDSFLEENPEITARVLKVLQKTAEWIKANKEEAKKTAAEATGVEPANVEASVEDIDLNVGLSEKDIETLVSSAQIEYEQKLINKELDVNQYIDTSYLEKAGIQ